MRSLGAQEPEEDLHLGGKQINRTPIVLINYIFKNAQAIQ